MNLRNVIGLVGAVLLFFSTKNALAFLIPCADYRGVVVQSHLNNSMSQAGYATFDSSGNPIRVFNQIMMSSYPMSVRYFIEAHECAHHAKGHLGPNRHLHAWQKELDADCMAFNYMSRNGHGTPQAWQEVSQFLGQLYESATHPSGAARAQRIQQCL